LRSPTDRVRLVDHKAAIAAAMGVHEIDDFGAPGFCELHQTGTGGEVVLCLCHADFIDRWVVGRHEFATTEFEQDRRAFCRHKDIAAGLCRE
jgi:hypothetical protein